jgi:hypothetical protein
VALDGHPSAVLVPLSWRRPRHPGRAGLRCWQHISPGTRCGRR